MLSTAFPEISALPVRFPGGFGSSTAYLIGGSPFTMIDSGPKQAGEDSLVMELAQRGLALSSISTVLLTHGHADHIGGAYKLKKAGASIAIGEEDRCWIEQHDEAFNNCERPVLVLRGKSDNEIRDELSLFLAQLPEAFEADIILKDGAVYELGGNKFRALSLPGHSLGAFGFLYENTGALFVGDNISGYGSPGGAFPVVWDLRAYLTSLKKLSELDVSGILSAHPYCAPGLAPATERYASEVAPFITASFDFANTLFDIASRYAHRKGDPFPLVADEIIRAMPDRFGYVPLDKQRGAANMTCITIAAALRDLAGWQRALILTEKKRQPTSRWLPLKRIMRV